MYISSSDFSAWWHIFPCEIFWKEWNVCKFTKDNLPFVLFSSLASFFSRFQGNCLDFFWFFFNFPSLSALPSLVGTSGFKGYWGSSYLVYIPGISKEESGVGKTVFLAVLSRTSTYTYCWLHLTASEPGRCCLLMEHIAVWNKTWGNVCGE